MADFFGLFSGKSPLPNRPDVSERSDTSTFFSSAFISQGIDVSQVVLWEKRAAEIGAKRLSAKECARLLQQLWENDRHMSRLDQVSLEKMEGFFEFASIPANRALIRQHEYSNFMVVLLKGTIAIDRVQPWGENLRLTETRPGDILGEMSLLDSGSRFSACTTLTECEIAVLDASSMDDLMVEAPRLATSFVTLLARKLSMRLRNVSARLNEPNQ